MDGPKASRSAMPDQALELRHEVEGEGRVVGRDEVVDERDGLAPGLDPDLLLAVLEDHVVAAVLAGAAGLAVADVGAGEVLELERDVLRHVAGPGPLAEPRDEAAAPAEGAGVVLEAWAAARRARPRSPGSCCSGTPRARPGPRPGGSPAPWPSSWRRAGRGSRGCAGWARGAVRPGPRPRLGAAAWPGPRRACRRPAPRSSSTASGSGIRLRHWCLLDCVGPECTRWSGPPGQALSSRRSRPR